MTAIPIIEAHQLTKTYAGGVEAVRGIDLEVAPGEVFGLLGPNGVSRILPIMAGQALRDC